MSLNENFLNNLTASFQLYLRNGARSNEKLKVIHSFISDSIKNTLNNSELSFYSLRSDSRISQELKVEGRYMDKAVDIAICQNGHVLAAIGFKFVMSNYKQNSNNYFENMLGETANIRCNNISYFQMLVIQNSMPYFNKHGRITKWEEITEDNIHKYIMLSEDDCSQYFHTPELTLLYIVKLQNHTANITNKNTYKNFYQNKPLNIDDSFEGFGEGVIINNFERFITKLSHFIHYRIS